MIPQGDESRARPLGKLEICNDATGDKRLGHYEGTLHAEYTQADGRKGRVMSFNRQRQSVWSLVGAFLKLWGHTRHSPKLMTKAINDEEPPLLPEPQAALPFEKGLKVIADFASLYEAEDFGNWMATPNPLLGNRSPHWMLKHDELQPVLAVMEQAITGAYA